MNDLHPVSGDFPRVAVIGAGLMGHSIAEVFMIAGAEVVVWDISAEARGSVTNRIESDLRLRGSDAPVRIQVASTLAEAVSDAGLVFEAMPEDLALKRSFVEAMDTLNPEAIIASNTSVLRVSEIATGGTRPSRVLGTHWWNPAHLVDIVEVVSGEQTDGALVERVMEWLRLAGKTPVAIAADVPGFIGNRLQFALWREAAAIVERGIADAATVDLIARRTFGRRLAAIGPLENADFIGLDLTAAIMDYVLPDLDVSTEAPAIIRRAVDEGRLGAKTGRGLFDWPDGRRAEVEARLHEHLLADSERLGATADESCAPRIEQDELHR